MMQLTAKPSRQTRTAAVLGAAILVGIVVGILMFGRIEHPTTPTAATIPVSAEEFRFVPGELRIKAGETVTLDLDNADFAPHSFDVDELGVHVAMPLKSRKTFTFTASQPGTYTVYCGVNGHREAGMVGTLVVEP